MGVGAGRDISGLTTVPMQGGGVNKAKSCCRLKQNKKNKYNKFLSNLLSWENAFSAHVLFFVF